MVFYFIAMTYRFSARPYRLPFRAPVRTAHGLWREREGLIVRLEGGGRVGWGEVAPVPGFGDEKIEEATSFCRSLGSETDESELERAPDRCACLRNAFSAARDELAEAALGPQEIPNGRLGRTLAVAALLPAGREAVAALRVKGELGFRIFKWKVGVGDLGDEIVLLDDVCAALPPGAKLRLDANGGWNRRQAEKWLERCADRPVEFVEQPVAAGLGGSEDLLQGLAADFPTPVGLDESLVGDVDIAHWLDAGWKGIFVIKPSLIGGLKGALARLAAARSAVVFSSALETAVGARSALRAAFDWPGEPRALGFGVGPLFADPAFDGPAKSPFLRWGEVLRPDREALWNALK